MTVFLTFHVTLTTAWTAEWCRACALSAVGCFSGHLNLCLVRQWGRLLFLTRFLLPGQAMMTPNMQGVIMAIGKSGSVYEKNGPEAAFFKVHTVSPPPVLISHSHQRSFVRCLFMFVLFASHAFAFPKKPQPKGVRVRASVFIPTLLRWSL